MQQTQRPPIARPAVVPVPSTDPAAFADRLLVTFLLLLVLVGLLAA